MKTSPFLMRMISSTTLTTVLVSLFLQCSDHVEVNSPLSSDTRQAVVVITDSLTATQGFLTCWERADGESSWRLIGHPKPVVLGRSGLGWGQGLHDTTNLFQFPVKREGDGRSPAGAFALSSVFGYAPDSVMQGLNMPYLPLDEFVECVDDVRSTYYNQVVSRQVLGEKVDWSSSEKMRSAGIYYELGVVVDHNTGPGKHDYGSCIFLHNWARSDETMAGCTALSPPDLGAVVQWLEQVKQPVLVQLTREAYQQVQGYWNLPNRALSVIYP